MCTQFVLKSQKLRKNLKILFIPDPKLQTGSEIIFQSLTPWDKLFTCFAPDVSHSYCVRSPKTVVNLKENVRAGSEFIYTGSEVIRFSLIIQGLIHAGSFMLLILLS